MTSPTQADDDRVKTIRWKDPALTAGRVPELSGLEFLQGILEGTIPVPPIMELLGARATAVEVGTVTFQCDPDESHYNPIGVVHGGLVCTLLDSALACAVQTTLPKGMAYTSLEIKVNYLRAVTTDSGTLTAVGTVTKPGSRAAFAEGTVHDSSGKLVATASSTCLVFPITSSSKQ